jgi:hypothetical protein
MRFREVAGQVPLRTIKSAFMALSSALWEALPRDGAASDAVGIASLPDLAAQANRLGLISPQTRNAVVALGVMYDLALSDPLKVDAAKALEFTSLADVVLHLLAQEKAQG